MNTKKGVILMKILLIILAIVFAVLITAMTFGMCRVSSKISREEEKNIKKS